MRRFKKDADPKKRGKQITKRSKKFNPIAPSKRFLQNKKLENEPVTKDFYNILNVETLLDSPRLLEFYDRTRKEKKIPRTYANKYLSTFFKIIRKSILENQAGVLINNFGYFGNFRNYRRDTVGSFSQLEEEKYNPLFLPLRKDSKLETWSMDGGFSVRFLNELRAKYREGLHYNTVFSLLQPLYGNRAEILTVTKKKKKKE